MKWVILLSWALSIFLAWGVSQNYQFTEFDFSLSFFLIIGAYLSVILWPIYWIFSVSEQLEEPQELNEESNPQAEIFIENIISRQNFENAPPLLLEKSELDADKIFFKVEKVAAGLEVKEELKILKKQTQIKILCLLSDQVFAIEKLQEEILMIVEMSEYLNNAEKMVLCHNIKQYISEKNLEITMKNNRE